MKTLSILTKCVVDRSKWLRGEGAAPSKLLRSTDGKMCCLGQFCLQAGATEQEIKEVVGPETLGKESDILCPQLVDGDAFAPQATGEAMTVNDDYTYIDDSKREAKLKSIFLTFTPPVELTFIN